MLLEERKKESAGNGRCVWSAGDGEGEGEDEEYSHRKERMGEGTLIEMRKRIPGKRGTRKKERIKREGKKDQETA